MNFRIGDLVSRISYKHDVVFKIVGFEGKTVFLKGVDLRLIADCEVDDLVKVSDVIDEDQKIIDANVRDIKIDRSQYFYLPGKILHIDGDSEYLERCMKFYDDLKVKANGISLNEDDIPYRIFDLLQESFVY